MAEKQNGDITNAFIQKAEQTEVGHFFVHYFRVIVAVIVLIVIGVGGFTGYSYWRASQDGAAAEGVFQFETGSWKSYQGKQLKIDELLVAWRKIQDQFSGSETIVPMAMEVSQELLNQGKLNEALDILKPLHEKFKSNVYLNFFIGHQLSVVYDDLNKDDEAIALLEHLVATKGILLKGKLYLDLGRICKRKGDKEKAVRYLQYLVDNFTNDPMAKMAKVYLKELK